MLSSPDREFTERQPELPGLALLLDSERLAESVRERGMLIPHGFEASYIRFKPNMSCMVGYRPRGTVGPPVFYATAFRRGSAKLVKAAERKLWPTRYGAGRVVLPDACVEICAFPNDDHLKGVGELANHESSARAIETLFGPRFRGANISLDVIAYKPERRCVFRLSADGNPIAALKVYVDQTFADAVSRASTLTRDSAVRFPALLASWDRRAVAALEWIPGRTLDEIAQEANPDMQSFFRAGEAIAQFHRGRIQGLRRVTIVQVVSHLRELVTGLATLHPALTPSASAAVDQLGAELLDEEGDDVTIHGDFYPKQVIATGPEIAFLDTDECAIGPAISDLGNFLAHLQIAVNRRQMTPSAATSARNAFLQGYGSQAAGLDERQLELWTAIGLLKVLHEPFRHHRPEWPTEMSLLANKVSELLTAAECTHL